jgi:hypothetical protein
MIIWLFGTGTVLGQPPVQPQPGKPSAVKSPAKAQAEAPAKTQAEAPAKATAEAPVTVAAGSPWENVKQYQAKGDGQHDDTAAIQKAIDAVASRGGGVVLLPPGTYLTSGEGLKIKSSGVSLTGVDENVSIIKHSGPHPAITVGTGTPPPCINNRIAGLKIVGAGANSHGIQLNDYAIRYNIENTWITGFAKGAAIKAVDHNHSGHISRVEINKNDLGISIGDHGQFTDISFSKIYHNNKYGIELVDCNVINILSTQIEKNGDSTGASIIAKGVDVLNIIGCYSEQDQKYPGPFLILTKGIAAQKCRAVNVMGTRSIGNKAAPHSVVLESVDGVSFIGCWFNSFSKGIFSLRPINPKGVQSIVGQTNYLGGPAGDKIF